jgi:hypothetical protein
MPVILQVNFVPGPTQKADTLADKLEAAHRIAELAGLAWKVWIQATEGETRGGIYLFDTLENARDWGERQLRSHLESAGASDVSLRYFDVNEAPSRITRAPLDTRVAITA